MNGPNAIEIIGGQSASPQVLHTDTKDLAGGNFRYITELGSGRKGHNVIDLFTGGDDNAYTTGAPPGKFRNNTHGVYFSPGGDTYANFTCAGSVGCHGTRSQALTSITDTTTGVLPPRRGIAAVSGAHHQNYDGLKDAVNPTALTYTGHSGQLVADGYRFIPGLKGIGNETPGDRWQNVNAASHNEYYGKAGGTPANSCNTCHVAPSSNRRYIDSTLIVPNNSMSGFCATCHGTFHASGGGYDMVQGETSTNVWGNHVDALDRSGTIGNGVSGAFLRHPSDYTIPAEREYANYTSYDVTAPVARPDLNAIANSSVVVPGEDLVMCLSCHFAHGSEHDYMLRGQYAGPMAAGIYGSVPDAQAQGFCLACHTTKGVLPENR
jgi:hypothetical protein